MNAEEVICASLDNAKNVCDTESENVETGKRDDRYRECNNEDMADIMTGSYGEICLDRDGCNDRKEVVGRKICISEGNTKSNDDEDNQIAVEGKDKRPTSLILEKGLTQSSLCDDPWKKNKCQQTSDSQTSLEDGSPSISSEFSCTGGGGSDTSGLSELHGTVVVDGDMVSYVAEDLQEKIKMSSPVSRSWTDTPSFPGSRSSTPSLYRQALQPHIPTIDAGAIIDLEVHACKVACCLDTMLENLSGTLQSISSLTVDCMETYQTSVGRACNGMDSNIKSMYQLMAKCEEVNGSMKPLYKIYEEIREIKRLLELFENIIEHKS